MQSIQDKAITTYQNNMSYLEVHHPQLYAKIFTLQTAIELGQYTERFSLEYKDNYFDVLDIASGEYLYNENSLIYSQKIVDMTTLERTGGIFQAQKYVDFSPEMPDIIDQSELSFHNALWATIKIIEYTRRFTDRNTTLMNLAAKSIFIGTGLGIHIPGVVTKLKSKLIFIQENDLELFRLSFFITDYASLGEKVQLFFSVMDNQIEERNVFVNFLETGNNHNLYLKHIPFLNNYESKLQSLQSHVLSMPHIHYGYSALLLRAIDSPKYIVRQYPFFDFSKRYENTPCSAKPVLFLFSGPSTGKNIRWIQENKDRFIIVTALSTCRMLAKYNIRPHVVFHIDPGTEQTASLFEGITDESFFENSLFILASNVDEKTVHRLDRTKVFFVQQGTDYKHGFENLSAPSVGEYAYAVFLLLGTQRLFLLGLDLALDPETLSTHSELHPFSQTGQIAAHQPSLNYKTNVEYVPGNFLDTIPTLSLYKLSIQEFNRFTEMLKHEAQCIFNLGNGAYLNSIVPTRIESIDWTSYPLYDTAQTTQELRTFFTSISSADYRHEDRTMIQYQLTEAKKLLFLITKHKQCKYKKADLYLEAIAKLGWDLSDMNYSTRSYLAEVYYDYFKVVLSYITDLFNTKDLHNVEKHILNIDSILVKQLEKIAQLFITRLESYLE